MIILICVLTEKLIHPLYDCIRTVVRRIHYEAPFPFRMWISYNNIRYNIKRISRWDAGYSTFYTWRCCCRTQNTWLCHIHVKRRFEYFMAKLLSSMLWIEIMWCFMHGKVMTMRFIFFFFLCRLFGFFSPMFVLKFRLWWLFSFDSNNERGKWIHFPTLKHFFSLLFYFAITWINFSK